jgi:hypothetical protein
MFPAHINTGVAPRLSRSRWRTGKFLDGMQTGSPHSRNGRAIDRHDSGYPLWGPEHEARSVRTSAALTRDRALWFRHLPDIRAR